jgi:NAD(P)-dependent dehydrogenase (short-subunit alcohol dehydrogenase family)
MARWTAADMPDLHGHLVLLTGATSGIGFEAAAQLAAHGADLCLLGRNAARGDAALAKIRSRHRTANVEFELIDMASLASIRGFADRFLSGSPAIDVLVNNAGVMAIPRRTLTPDGFEMQFGTNYLGHFALTALLLPALLRSLSPRVVTVASLAHRSAQLDFDDLQSAKRYDPLIAYRRSKLADLIFALELHRRAAAAGSRLKSIAVHPGLAMTGILSRAGTLARLVMGTLGHLVTQSAARGALPTLYGATSPDAMSGGYYGPDGPGEMWGYPAPARIAPQAADPITGARLWSVSEQLTRIRFPSLASGPAGDATEARP